MEKKTRVKKGEEYWYLSNYSFESISTFDAYSRWDNINYKNGNYFHTKEEAEAIAKKLKAILNGADVIETPSENLSTEEIEDHWFRRYLPEVLSLDDLEAYVLGFKAGVYWLKSKIIK